MKNNRKNPNAGNSRVRNILKRIQTVASGGVNFNFYEPWYPEDVTDDMTSELIAEKEIQSLEMKLCEC